MPKLSVVMPVYNTAKFLRRAVDSVLAQTFSDLELILVNDGSRDNSLDICREYESRDARVRVIDKENGGAGSARNAGMAAASGEYIAFPDSDDWIDADAYRFCIERMEAERLDLLVFGSLNTVYDGEERVLLETEGAATDLILRTQEECRAQWAKLVRAYPMDGPSNKMYRLSLIKEQKVTYPDLRRMQDGVFNMRYYDKISSVGFVKKYFYHFTEHSEEFQRKKMPKAFLDCAIGYHREALGFLSAWGMLTPENERLFGEWFSETVFVAAFDYLPTDGKGFSAGYRHIKSVTGNPYVKAFYRRYARISRLMKKEIAVKNGWNLILTFLTVRES